MIIKTVGVIGAGVMGRGIAQVALTKGYKVLLVDAQTHQLESAAAEISLHCQDTANLQLSPEFKKLDAAELIIEAVTEDFALKASVLTQLNALKLYDTLVATNSSSCSITSLAALCKDPTKFLGIHFMNPAPLMPLVEIIPGLKTSDTTILAAKTWVQHLGKTLILSPDRPGFILNRLLIPMVNEAVFLLQDNMAPLEDIDATMRLGANHPMGPLRLADFIGLDTCLAIMQVLHQELGNKYLPCPLLCRYVQAGWLGRKVGRGFYVYPAN